MTRYLSRDLGSDCVAVWESYPEFDGSSYYGDADSYWNFGYEGGNDVGNVARRMFKGFPIERGQLLNLTTGQVIEDHGTKQAEDMEPGLYKYTGSRYPSVRYIVVLGNGDRPLVVWDNAQVTRSGDDPAFNSDTLEHVG